jgi:transcriptional regulator with XRE-family HTH domain
MSKDINNTIASKMKMVRKMNGLNLNDVSKILNVSPQQVQKYESGITRVPFSKLFLFASYFKISPEFFFKKED